MAPRALSAKRVDASALAAAFDFVGQPGVLARAAELGQAMVRENGLGTAVATVERIVAAGRVAPPV